MKNISKFILSIGLGMMVFGPMVQAQSLPLKSSLLYGHDAGSLVVSNGTVYKIYPHHKRAFPSAIAFLSYGYKFSDVQPAYEGDLSLADGEVMNLKDGALFKDRNSYYIIEHGKKRKFASLAILRQFGYNASNAISADLSSVPNGANISSAKQRHSRGTLVADSGTIYFMGTDLRYPHPSAEVFLSWDNRWEEVVPANSYDLNIPVGSVMGLSPYYIPALPTVPSVPAVPLPPVNFAACNQEKAGQVAAIQNKGGQPLVVTGKVIFPNPNYNVSELSVFSYLDVEISNPVRSDGSYCAVIDQKAEHDNLLVVGKTTENPILFAIAHPSIYHGDLIIDAHGTAQSILLFPFILFGANIEEVLPLVQSVPEAQNFTQAYMSAVLSTSTEDGLFELFNDYLAGLYEKATEAIDSRLSKRVLKPVEGNASDLKRLADIRQYQTALELYYNYYGGYPSNPSVLAPTYLVALPTAPQPVDGQCTTANNAYTYTPIGASYTSAAGAVYPSYTITFCLGGETEGYFSGSKTATPAGIK